MSQPVNQGTVDPVRSDERTVSERGTVGAVFAGVLMIIGGCFGSLQGIALIADGSFYVQPAHYWIDTSASTWGWVLLIVGVVVLVAGFGGFHRRHVGVLARHRHGQCASVANFLFIPVQPSWSIILIVVDLWVIHSLLVHRRIPT